MEADGFDNDVTCQRFHYNDDKEVAGGTTWNRLQ